tara:strand:- start:455 stop:607 length:153 start_codon:yes stop_codon:yes gene_type:complete
MNEERLYSILTKVIDKLTNQVGIAEEEILDMFEISENEIKELSIKNRKLN